MTTDPDVIVIGAGAAGLMCAIEAGKRGRRVVVLDHANKAGKKILMSGGGRCNFTNLDVDAAHYLSHNSHFCKSALSRYSQWDFIALVEKHRVAYHERDHGQLFCNESSKDILTLLQSEAHQAGVTIKLETTIGTVRSRDPEGCNGNGFELLTSAGVYHCAALVVATGGLSIPKMGATPFGYQLAEQFGIKVWPTRAGLVPLTLQADDKARLAELAGVALECTVSNRRQSFRGNLLLTHRGLSGPAILQLSSYWEAGEAIDINLHPQGELTAALEGLRAERPRMQLKSALHTWLPRRLVTTLFGHLPLDAPLQTLPRQLLESVAQAVHHWTIKPNGTEGYRTAEVTLGGVDCAALSSKTLESTAVAGLYFIGEVVDVTGWLGGYNFQWAWSSGWCAGQYV